jgi:error-prone DNA polymerase
VLVYQSAWLKRYYPAAFYTAILNNQPMGFWQPVVLVNDARRHDLQVLPVDIHRSGARCTIEGGAIRLGFQYIDGVGETSAAAIVQAREAMPFTGLADFWRRTRLPRPAVESLILAGVIDSWGMPRRDLLWELGKLRPDELDLRFDDEAVELPPLSPMDKMDIEYQVLGLSTGQHVLARSRSWLSEQNILSSRELDKAIPGQQVTVAGLVVVHQAPPTAKGHHFITLEDEFGLMNVIVRPAVYESHRRVIRGSALLIFDGLVQRQDSVVNLVASQAKALPVPDR